MKSEIWIGTVLLSPLPDGKKKEYIGAYASVACCADSFNKAVELIIAEFYENRYEVIGFENFMPMTMLERELTDYEKTLVDATSAYPVQFKNVHLFKGNS